MYELIDALLESYADMTAKIVVHFAEVWSSHELRVTHNH